MTNSELDKFGEQLRETTAITEPDLLSLEAFRDTFTDARQQVVSHIRKTLGVPVSVRHAKTTGSIIAKLQREPNLRLSLMHDVAGCRIVVADHAAQEHVIQTIRKSFSTLKIVDRRRNPSHSYRAVHVIVSTAGKQVEVQIRTTFQHRWAEISEKTADAISIDVKYGKGPSDVMEILAAMSKSIAECEALEKELVHQSDTARLAELQKALRACQKNVSAQLKL